MKTLIIVTPYKPFDWRNSDQAALDMYRQAVREAVSENSFSNTKVADIGDGVAGNSDYYADDFWHYNFAGQKVLADELETFF